MADEIKAIEIDPEKIEIDPEFEAWGKKYDLEDEQLIGLEHMLKADGFQDPLKGWEHDNGKVTLVDGYHRYRICKANNIPFKVVSVPSIKDKDRAAAFRWMKMNQFSRGNLTDYARGEIADELRPEIAEIARQKQVDGAKIRLSETTEKL